MVLCVIIHACCLGRRMTCSYCTELLAVSVNNKHVSLLCNFKAAESLSTQPPSPKEFIWILPASLLTATQQKAYQSSIFILQRFCSGRKITIIANTNYWDFFLFLCRIFCFICSSLMHNFKRACSAWVHLQYIMVCIMFIVPSSILQKLQTVLLCIMVFIFFCDELPLLILSMG